MLDNGIVDLIMNINCVQSKQLTAVQPFIGCGVSASPPPQSPVWSPNSSSEEDSDNPDTELSDDSNSAPTFEARLVPDTAELSDGTGIDTAPTFVHSDILDNNTTTPEPSDEAIERNEESMSSFLLLHHSALVLPRAPPPARPLAPPLAQSLTSPSAPPVVTGKIIGEDSVSMGSAHAPTLAPDTVTDPANELHVTLRMLRQYYKRQTTLRDTASLNLTFLGQCRVNHLVPKGLRLRKGCAAAAPSDNLRTRFKSTLDEASSC